MITARLLLQKEGTGGKAEVLCISPLQPSVDPAVALAARSGESVWRCMVGGKKIKKGARLTMKASIPHRSAGTTKEDTIELELIATIEEKDGKDGIVRFSWQESRQLGGSIDSRNPAYTSPVADMSFGQVLETVGKIPLPPYMNRASDEADSEDYQTVYAKAQGSVAAPTAGRQRDWLNRTSRT